MIDMILIAKELKKINLANGYRNVSFAVSLSKYPIRPRIVLITPIDSVKIRRK